MTEVSEGLPLNSKYIKMGREEGLSSFPHTATPRNCLPCGLTAFTFFDRKKSLGGSSL